MQHTKHFTRFYENHSTIWPCSDDQCLLYLDFRKQVLGNQYSTPGLFPGTIPTIQPLLAKKASYGEAGQVITNPKSICNYWAVLLSGH